MPGAWRVRVRAETDWFGAGYSARRHDALVTDLLTFVGLLKFSVGNSGVMSAS